MRNLDWTSLFIGVVLGWLVIPFVMTYIRSLTSRSAPATARKV